MQGRHNLSKKTLGTKLALNTNIEQEAGENTEEIDTRSEEQNQALPRTPEGHRVKST